MSGSGGGGGGGGVTPVFDCTSLVIDTQISSPKPAVIGTLKVGDLLDVEARTSAGTVVVVLLYKGKVAGGLASPQLHQLRECLDSGTQYHAEVKSIKAGQVRVRVEAV
jgi:hypothetical protein